MPEEVFMRVFDAMLSDVFTSMTPKMFPFFAIRRGEVSVPRGSQAIFTVNPTSRILRPQSKSVTGAPLTFTVTLSEAFPPAFEHVRV